MSSKSLSLEEFRKLVYGEESPEMRRINDFIENNMILWGDLYRDHRVNNHQIKNDPLSGISFYPNSGVVVMECCGSFYLYESIEKFFKQIKRIMCPSCKKNH